MRKCTKVKLTKKQAEDVIRRAQKGKQHRREKRQYYCDECNAWHTTSKEHRNDLKQNKIELLEKERWDNLLSGEPPVVDNVLAKVAGQDEIKFGTIYNSAGVSSFNDGHWNWADFTPFLRIRSFKPLPKKKKDEKELQIHQSLREHGGKSKMVYRTTGIVCGNIGGRS